MRVKLSPQGHPGTVAQHELVQPGEHHLLVISRPDYREVCLAIQHFYKRIEQRHRTRPLGARGAHDVPKRVDAAALLDASRSFQDAPRKIFARLIGVAAQDVRCLGGGTMGGQGARRR